VARRLERAGCHPEVALAVRIRTTTAAGDDDEEERADEILSQLGFEFVDVRDSRTGRGGRLGDDDDDSDG
jgi:hypothetical protein